MRDKKAITIFLAPALILPSTALGLLWMFIFSPKLGINQALEKFGIEGPLWLMDTSGFIILPMWIIAFVALWQYVGQSMMLYMAQISGISTSLYEASYIDGCSKPKSFIYITLPLIKPMVATAMSLNAIGSLKFFDLIFSMLIGSMAAFAIGRLRFKLAKPCMTFFLLGMMIPVHCVMIPLFTKFAKIGLSNSLIGLIIPYLTFSLPTTIFIMTGFFQSMPNELIESACIDGSSIYGIFFKIALPLSKTGLFVTGLMTFVANWNELLLAMVFISDDAKKTLPVSLSKFVGPYNTNYSQMFAAIIIAIIPTVIVYCIFSNQIVDGLTAGAVKG